MRGVSCDHEHEGLDHLHAVLTGIGQQLDLGGFVKANAIFQLDLLDLFCRVRLGVEIALGHGCRLFDEAVFHSPCQWVVHHNVLEGHRATRGFHERGGRHLKSKQGLQFVDGPYPRAGPVAMRLVHQQHQVVQAGQVVEVAVSQHLPHALDARLLAPTHLRVDLGDVEDVNAYVVGKAHRLVLNHRTGLVVVVARDDQGRLLRELRDSLEHVLGRVAREVGDQLVVDRQVGRQHEEVVDAMRQVQVGNERAHQPCLAHACGQREAQRGELAFKVLQRREFRLQRGKDGRHILVVAEQLRRSLDGAHELRKGLRLRWAQRQPASHGVLDACIHSSFSPNRPPCPAFVAADFLVLRAAAPVAGPSSSAGSVFSAIGRLATLRL